MEIKINVDETEIIKMALDGMKTEEIKKELARKLVEKTINSIDDLAIGWKIPEKLLKSTYKKAQELFLRDFEKELRVHLGQTWNIKETIYGWMEEWWSTTIKDIGLQISVTNKKRK